MCSAIDPTSFGNSAFSKLCWCVVQADLDNLIQVNQLLRRVQTKAHKDLSFVQGRIAQYHEGFRQLEAQNHHLQQAILTMSAVGACATRTPALDTNTSD